VNSEFKKNLNVLITFTISGFWHGSDWTFIIWGASHGIFYFIQMAYGKTLGNIKILPSNLVALCNWFFTYFAVTAVWILFRADDLDHTIALFHQVTSSSLFESPIQYLKDMGSSVKPYIIIIGLFYLGLFEILNKNALYSFQVGQYKKPMRWFLYISLVLILLFFRATGGKLDFIYFQF
jgi:D-alanyl-lipoteichoic acid acyltransferase DltB (MBOAT superfamily)